MTAKLDKMIRALLQMPASPHVRPPTPTKADLERKFRIRLDRNEKPRFEEV